MINVVDYPLLVFVLSFFIRAGRPDVSIAFFLIGDIDSARGGVIRVHPQNLRSVADSLRVH